MKEMRFSAAAAIVAAALLASACTGGKLTEKQVYIPQDLQGMDLNDTASQWCWQRCQQNADLAIFWEKGFGIDLDSAPDYLGHNMKVDLPNLMDRAQYFYDFFKDTLAFIQPGSKADSLKMMIMLMYSDEGTAYGGDYDSTIGGLWITPLRTYDKNLNCIAHELGHSFQSQLGIDGNTGFGSGGMYEMTSQYMLWQVNEDWMTSENYHWQAFMDLTHLAFMHPDNMYHSPYVLEYWSDKHGKRFIADLWRSARHGHDVVKIYEDLTGTDDAAFGQEMYEFASHSMTYDFDRIRESSAPYANKHRSTLAAAGKDGWQRISAGREPQQYGYNGIGLAVPEAGSTVSVSLRGDNVEESEQPNACWTYGLVGVTADGTPIYSESKQVKFGEQATLEFTTPQNQALEYLWLVVTATPLQHKDIIEWDEDAHYAQYPYSVRLDYLQ